MTPIQEYSTQADLALAAYAELVVGTPIPAALTMSNVGMSASQAERFAEQWAVVAQYNGASGVSATVFQDKAGKNYLAIRGTEPTDPGDITADIDVLVGAHPRDIPQYQFLRSKVTEWLANGTLKVGFTVAGHSLGGFLAAALTAEFANAVGHAYLYNAPGFGGSVDLVLSPAQVSNIKSEVGISPIAGLGVQAQPIIQIANEAQIPGAVSNVPVSLNHDQAVLTETLALYAAISGLAPALMLESFGKLLRSASAQNKLTLESALDALRVTFLGATAVAVAPTTTKEGNRNDFYKNLYALQESAAYNALAGSAALRLTADETADSLAQNAKNDFGWFLAVHALLPIAIEGSGSPLIGANPDLYARWSADRGKRIDGNGDLEFTDTYLGDRAKMLTWLMQGNTTDRGYGPITGGENWQFLDVASGQAAYALSTASAIDGANAAAGDAKRLAAMFDEEMKRNLGHRVGFGGDGGDQITGGGLDDRLYGMAGDDILQGRGGNDHIEGGKDDDLLIGGKGDDLLNGGQGYDTYAWSAGDGNDTILDLDRRGRIVINGLETTVLIKNGAAWASPDGKVTLSQGDTWKLSMDGGSLELGTNFQSGDLGINLTEATTGGTIIRGDLKPIDHDITTPEEDLQYDSLGNVIVSSTEAPGREDRLLGSESADTILGLEGNDILNGRGGNDLMEGGSGTDILIGDAGGDTLYGLSGPAGSTPLATALAAGDTDTNQTTRGDWIDGQSGDDLLIGTAAQDLLTGGTDNDLLIGGSGDDLLLGDVSLAAGQLDWNDTRTVEHNAETNTDLYRWTINQGTTTQSDSVGGADVLYGGKGQDWLLGGAGDDLVDGGSDNDVLFGEAGNDVILGGTGNDVINGDRAGLPDDLQGSDWIDGGDGADRIWGMAGDDIIIGGKGDDYIHGGAGRDTYIFNKGDGIDEIHDDDTGPEKSILIFGEGFDKNTIKLRQGSLLLDLGDGDAIHIENFDPDHPLDTQSFASFQFADGSSLTPKSRRWREGERAANDPAWRRVA